MCVNLGGWLAVAQILDVHVRPRPFVVRKIPTNVVRILVNHDVVRIPKPVAAVPKVTGRYAEIKSAEPESGRPPAPEVPHVMQA